jgi:hypothetical protein
MNITNSNVLMSLVAACFLAEANLHAQFPTPQIVCTINNCLNPLGGGAMPAVCDVANGNEIKLHIGLNTITFNPLVAPALNPNPIPLQGEYFLLKVIRDSDGAEMHIKVNDTGGFGKDLNYLTAEIYLEIPETKEIRQAKALAAWVKAKSQHLEANHWGVKDADMANALEQNLVENQLGHYKVICSYISNKPGTWDGQVSSIPIEINVIYKGTSLDKLTNP